MDVFQAYQTRLRVQVTVLFRIISRDHEQGASSRRNAGAETPAGPASSGTSDPRLNLPLAASVEDCPQGMNLNLAFIPRKGTRRRTNAGVWMGDAG